MPLLHLMLISICIMFICTEAASAVDVKKAVGDEVSFSPATAIPPGASIIWKHRSASGSVIKVIEYDEDGTQTRNPKFQGITTLDEKTGEITIKNLTLVHSGDYTIDINSREQEQKFTLTVMERVRKPVIKTEKSEVNPDVVYLTCENRGKIIWRNSAGETLEGSSLHLIGESITVYNQRNPEKFYTCTLLNDVSEETSERVYERDLFIDPDLKFYIWIAIVLINMAFIIVFLFIPPMQVQ
ncbi:uncharacterized protein LOC130221444 [Danio aesculapii]|uniref:uncharacterized protein LOC130221444 n=1 Tax=Danio aesculapii TaxID=1142201 RepID=UPI0024BFDF9B|nr:uncharacterized protein LOC130221444 [Danio aesculapii]